MKQCFCKAGEEDAWKVAGELKTALYEPIPGKEKTTKDFRDNSRWRRCRGKHTRARDELIRKAQSGGNKKRNGNAVHVAGEGTESKYVMYMRLKILRLFGDEARAKPSGRTPVFVRAGNKAQAVTRGNFVQIRSCISDLSSLSGVGKKGRRIGIKI